MEGNGGLTRRRRGGKRDQTVGAHRRGARLFSGEHTRPRVWGLATRRPLFRRTRLAGDSRRDACSTLQVGRLRRAVPTGFFSVGAHRRGGRLFFWGAHAPPRVGVGDPADPSFVGRRPHQLWTTRRGVQSSLAKDSMSAERMAARWRSLKRRASVMCRISSRRPSGTLSNRVSSA